MRIAQDAEGVGPYGSVVKYNRSRQQFELKKHQAPDQNYIDLDLIHRKFNEGKLLDHIGIRVSFIDDGNGTLDKVTFASLDVAKHPVFGAARPLPQRLDDVLTEGAMTLDELADLISDKSRDMIRATLNRDKDRFVKLPSSDKWGRRTHGK